MILPWWWRWAALALFGLACAAGGAAKMYQHDRKAYDKLAEEFSTFKGGVAALGAQAKREADATNAANKKRKEDADAQNKRDRDSDARTIAGLRLEADRTRRGFLSSPPATSKCPSGQTCFDRADLERAYGELVTEVRAGADEGTAVTQDLNTAKRWAKP